MSPAAAARPRTADLVLVDQLLHAGASHAPGRELVLRGRAAGAPAVLALRRPGAGRPATACRRQPGLRRDQVLRMCAASCHRAARTKHELVLAEQLHRPERPLDDPYGRLTEREREVFHLIAEGMTTKDIAQRLGISAKTAENHRGRVLDKLGVRNTAELVRYALRKGLVE